MHLPRLVVLFVLATYTLPSSGSTVDSLKQLLPGNKPDTGYVHTLIRLGNALRKPFPDSAVYYHTQAQQLAKEKGFSLLRVQALGELGWDYFTKSDTTLALKYCKQGIKLLTPLIKSAKNKKAKNRFLYVKIGILESLGNIYVRNGWYEKGRHYIYQKADIASQLSDYENVADANNGIARSFYMEGNFYKALDYCLIALKASEKSGNEQVVASNLGNIGIIFKEQRDYTKALDYFSRALTLHRKLGNKRSEGIVLGNIGVVYQMSDRQEKALEYFLQAIKINEELGENQSLVYNYNNVGIMYNAIKRHKEAIPYFEKSLSIIDPNDLFTLVFTYNSIAAAYVNLKQYNLANKYSELAEKTGKQINSINLLRNTYEIRSDLFEATGKSAQALVYYKKYIALRDSLNNEEKTRKSIQLEANFRYQRKAAADSVNFAKQKQINRVQLAKKEAEIRADRNLRYSLYGGLGLLLLFGVFMFNRFKVTKKQNEIIKKQKLLVETQKKEAERQKMLVEEKQKEIIDSINYAKRIQTALLPPARVINEFFDQGFILYLPKDIVAGDFYWFYPLEEENGKSALIAAVDCTGHGVPGAMVSVIANNSLNRSVLEFGCTDPADVLNKARELMIAEFTKSDEDVRDGMDISLCYLKYGQDVSQQVTLRWAGANNPLCILRTGSAQIEEWKPLKQSIGKGEVPKPFTTQETTLNKGDRIYLFTDGYADQFGGDQGKKLKKSKLIELLTFTSALPMNDQYQKLLSSFEDWKGQLEQIDDVCVIGVRL